jgi:hypothetical protein
MRVRVGALAGGLPSLYCNCGSHTESTESPEELLKE